MVNPHLDKMNPLISRLINDLWRKLDFVMEQDLYYQYFPAILFTLILRRENLLKNVPYDIRENIVSENLVYLFDNNEIEKFTKHNSFKLNLEWLYRDIPSYEWDKYIEAFISLEDDLLLKNFTLIFDGLIIKFVDILPVTYKTNFCSSEITDLIIRLADSKENAKIYSPYVGFTALSASLDNFQLLVNHEDDTTLFNLCILRYIAYNRRLDSSVFISSNPLTNWNPTADSFDLILSLPPFVNKLKEHLKGHFVNEYHNFEQFIIEQGIGALNPKGRLIIVVPQNFLYSQTGSEHLRAHWLIGEDLLDTVISIPGGLYHSHRIPSAIIVIDKNKRNKGLVRFIDGNKFIIQADKNHSYFDSPRLLSHIEANLESDSLKYVSNRVIAENSYRIDIPIYFQKSVDGVILSEVVSQIFSKRKTKSRTGKLVRIRDLKNDIIDYQLLDDQLENAEISSSAQEISESCLLLATRWNSLKPTFFKYTGLPIYVSNDITALIVDESKIDIAYLINELYEDYVIDQVEAFKTGSYVPYLKISDLLRVKIKLPSLPDQQKAKIAGVHQEYLKSKLKEEGYQIIMSNLKREIVENYRIKKHNIMQHLNSVKSSADVLFKIMKENNGFLDSKYIINPNIGSTVESRFISLIDSLHDAMFYVDKINDDIAFDDNIEELPIQDLLEYCVEKGRNDDFFSIEIEMSELTGYSESDNTFFEPYINFSRKDFLQLYHNILENAIRHGFTDKNRKYKFRIEGSFRGNPGKAVISFMNNGNQFPKGMAQRYCLKGEKAGPYANKGLGTWIACEIAKHYSAELQAYDLPEDEFPVRIDLNVENIFFLKEDK